ncbi:DUF3306 domain-containing protein [Hydrogenophaga sp.]|uniref:DUF3306 domain-containing protein n=1 Tax=Hydrogenophaga sp. TaxID=1904254 RepID=UPI003F6D9BEB
MAAEDDNFFSRWSRRKVQVRTGQPLAVEPPAPAASAAPVPVPLAAGVSAKSAPTQTEPEQTPASPPAEAPPELTLDDVARLTRDADFKPFVGRQVPAEVRNAAMKKLFTDPHYNVMDGLDIYIDDYSQPSPLSAAMMAKMVGAQFLKLVDDPNEAKPAAAPASAAAEAAEATEEAQPDTDTDTDTDTDAPPAQADAAADAAPESTTGTATAPAQPENHDDHVDLQLQPDHAAERESPGRGAG